MSSNKNDGPDRGLPPDIEAAQTPQKKARKTRASMPVLSSEQLAELQRRIRERLDYVGLTAAAAAEMAGFNHTFLNDLLGGKRKKSLSQGAVPRIALVLRCDAEYLMLTQPTPKRDAEKTPEAKYRGVLKPGGWDEKIQMDAVIPIIPSIVIPGIVLNAVYRQTDETLAGEGIHAGEFLYTEKGAKSADGDVVILKRKNGALLEFSARVRVAPGRYEFRPAPGCKLPPEPRSGKIETTELGVVRIHQNIRKKIA